MLDVSDFETLFAAKNASNISANKTGIINIILFIFNYSYWKSRCLEEQKEKKQTVVNLLDARRGNNMGKKYNILQIRHHS